MKIRRAASEDAPAVAQLCAEIQAWHAAAYPEIFQAEIAPGDLAAHFTKQITDPDTRLLIAEISAEPAAYLYSRVVERDASLFQKPRRRLFIEHIGTSKRFRRRGLARALLAEAESIAQREGCADMFLDTWEANGPAKQTFEAAGLSLARRLYAKPL
ncbi:MAG: GNAT family N-acetyltransferase [Pseudomonadota bacterium]